MPASTYMADPGGPPRRKREEIEGEPERVPAEKTGGGERTMVVVVVIFLIALVLAVLIFPHSPIAAE